MSSDETIEYRVEPKGDDVEDVLTELGTMGWRLATTLDDGDRERLVFYREERDPRMEIDNEDV